MSKSESDGRCTLLTAAEMRLAEGAAISGGAVSGLDLMERAGRGVVAAVFERWPALAAAPHRAVVFCGPGNNGGDGYVIARLLAEWGWQVRVRALGDPDTLPPDARANRDRWCALGEVRPLDAGAVADDAPADLVVDALFGTGLTRPVDPAVTRPMATLAGASGAHCVAVDLPSGLCSDSGRPLGAPCRADLTVTFHTAKPGHVLAEGPHVCGALEIVDIGLPASHPVAAARLIDAPPGLGKGHGHKYDHGHALILSGGFGRTGAARLAAAGALRIGAGLVTVAAPAEAMAECAAQLTAVMVRRCDGAGDLATLLDQDHRINALCLGPGLGTDDHAAGLVERALDLAVDGGRGVVLDADALTCLAAAPERLFDKTSAAVRVVLTPHFGEFRRLFPDLAERLSDPATQGPAFSRLDAVRIAASRAGCVVLLKGPDTVIAAPDGTAAVHAAVRERAVPWLATAGAGDVLSGIITGLLARGFTPDRAAQAAAWLHVEAARAVGPGLIAEDLPGALRPVLEALDA